MSFWPVELRAAAPVEDRRASDRLAFFVVTLVVVPLAAAATVAVLAGGLADAGSILGAGIVAGSVASSFAVWRSERWDVVAGVALTATVCGAFLSFGVGATTAFWLFMLDPCSGPCL
jgi:hypothetical protein